jgi:hypothetical protein
MHAVNRHALVQKVNVTMPGETRAGVRRTGNVGAVPETVRPNVVELPDGIPVIIRGLDPVGW